ncbi:hypothetical protein D3C85_499080 [compost metagenome]
MYVAVVLQAPVAPLVKRFFYSYKYSAPRVGCASGYDIKYTHLEVNVDTTARWTHRVVAIETVNPKIVITYRDTAIRID